MLSFLICDEDPAYRASFRDLAQTLLPQAQMKESGCANSLLTQLANPKQFDALFFDPSLLGSARQSLWEQLKKAAPKLPVYILSDDARVDSMVRCLRAGADGYLLKSTQPGVIAEVLQKIASSASHSIVIQNTGALPFKLDTSDLKLHTRYKVGKSLPIFDKAQAASLTSTRLPTAAKRQKPATQAAKYLAYLSTRQAQVLKCLMSTMSTQQICKQLKISQSTVKTHTAAVFRALTVKSRSQAVQKAKSLDLF